MENTDGVEDRMQNMSLEPTFTGPDADDPMGGDADGDGDVAMPSVIDVAEDDPMTAQGFVAAAASSSSSSMVDTTRIEQPRWARRVASINREVASEERIQLAASIRSSQRASSHGGDVASVIRVSDPPDTQIPLRTGTGQFLSVPEYVDSDTDTMSSSVVSGEAGYLTEDAGSRPSPLTQNTSGQGIAYQLEAAPITTGTHRMPPYKAPPAKAPPTNLAPRGPPMIIPASPSPLMAKRECGPSTCKCAPDVDRPTHPAKSASAYR